MFSFRWYDAYFLLMIKFKDSYIFDNVFHHKNKRLRTAILDDLFNEVIKNSYLTKF